MFSRFQWSLFIGTIRWSIGCFWKKTIQYTMLNIELVSGRSGSHSQVDRLWNQMDQDSWIRNQEFTLDQKWTRQPEIRWWPFEDRFKPLKRVTIWSKKLVWKHRQRKDWSGSSGSLVVGGASCDTTWPRRKIDFEQIVFVKYAIQKSKLWINSESEFLIERIQPLCNSFMHLDEGSPSGTLDQPNHYSIRRSTWNRVTSNSYFDALNHGFEVVGCPNYEF